MGLKDFYTQLAARLSADTELSQWAATHFGRVVTYFGPDHSGEFENAELPAAIVLQDAGENEVEPSVTLGGKHVDITTALLVEIHWKEDAPAKATTQRLELVDVIAKAIMRDNALAGSVTQAWFSGWEWDDTREPVQILRATIRASYRLSI